MIQYHHDQTDYKFKQRRLINAWLRASALEEGYRLTDLNVIFCSAERLREMNVEFLQHDYFTDIITFDYSDLEEAKIVAGDLFIDVDTVSDNASIYGATPLREMHRVILHGVLHLCGQGDKAPGEAEQMRAKEDHYLAKLDTMES